MSFNECKVSALGEIVELVIDYRGKTPKKLGGDWSEKGYRALSAKNIKTGKIVQEDSIRFVDENLYKKWMKDEICKGDILITSEAPFGEVYHWNTHEKIVLSQRLFGLRVNKDNYSKYVYYFMTSESFQGELYNRATGTTVVGLRQPELLKCIVTLPSLPEQISIAETLSCLDEKIELNNRINKTLEEMAQAIFKQWFVDFEFPNENGQPYKSSGGEMEESELGLIPKGWKVGVFNNLIADSCGGDWGKDSIKGNYTCEVLCIRGADIPEIEAGKSGRMPLRFILKKNFELKALNDGDIVIEISGGSPTQSTGRTVLISKELLRRFDKPLICSNFCRKVKVQSEFYSEFLYLYLRFLYKGDVFFQFENGTTGIKNLDINNLFNKYPIVLPEELLVKRFRLAIQKLIEMIQENGRQSQNLTDIRDSLLPKLMSGEIRVPIEEVP